jgi:hypothetical protein
MKQLGSLSISELARINLALMMNKREIPSQLGHDVFQAIV